MQRIFRITNLRIPAIITLSLSITMLAAVMISSSVLEVETNENRQELLDMSVKSKNADFKSKNLAIISSNKNTPEKKPLDLSDVGKESEDYGVQWSYGIPPRPVKFGGNYFQYFQKRGINKRVLRFFSFPFILD